MVFLLYYLLLAVWPLLLWPAFRNSGWSRWWLLIAAGAGLLATAHEVRILTGSPAAIRLDIPLIAMVLGALYGVAVGVMFRGRWRKTASVVGCVLVLAGGAMTYVWIETGHESARLTKLFHARNALMFEAKFRGDNTYATYFRMNDARPAPHPTGHWVAQDGGAPQGEGRFSRLIINPEGRAWVFYRCGETECTYHSTAPGVKPAGDGAERTWQVTFRPGGGAPLIVTITQPGTQPGAQSAPDQLILTERGQPATFTKTPPPINPAPARRALSFLGPFSQMDCRGQHAGVRQVWLWQEGARLYATGVFATLLTGAHAGYLSPVVLGEGERKGDQWTFQWRRNGKSRKASISLEGPAAQLKLVGGGKDAGWGALKRKAIFHDEVMELAPLTTKADWDHWFSVVLTAHFTSGDIPAC